MNANGLTLLFRSHTTGNDSPADLGDKGYNQYFMIERNMTTDFSVNDKNQAARPRSGQRQKWTDQEAALARQHAKDSSLHFVNPLPPKNMKRY
jgi:hypothetical protein